MSAPAAGAATSKSCQYDVFINHRGPDVKYTFVAHLYDALRRWGIKIQPFLDAKDIEYGHHVFEEIDKALKGACVHVAIFSKGYAESIYCLDELCAMLESNQPIIPVFYDVEAGNLRRPEDGPYKEAFKKHEERGRIEKIPRWKEALHKVADFRGFRMDEVNGNEHVLIKKIVEEVRKALPPDLLPGSRIGLEKSMKDVVEILQSVRVIGLVGTGGIGKTTLAMEVYNHFVSCLNFECYSFLKDVRSNHNSELQNKLLHDLGVGSESRYIGHAQYTRTLRGALKDRRVLVIVDDISDANQLEALIPEINELGSECRIVITSRQHNVLRNAMKTLPTTSKAVYEVQTLDKSYSRHLFNMHAFGSETPNEGFVELAEKISDACDGLPLSLTVMGRYLFEQMDKEIWVESMKVLHENSEIFDKLRISYDGLPTDGDRAMFLDIACVLIGVKQGEAMTIWKSCSNCSCSGSKTPASSLRKLRDRSLVNLDEDDRLRMHDVLRDMGRNVVKRDRVKDQERPPKKRTHLWDPVMAEQELSRGKVNTKTRGICLAVTDPDIKHGLFHWEESTISFEASKLGRMQELHLLRLDGCNMVHDGSCSGYQQLRWVQWKSYQFRSLPPQLKLPQLVVLDLSYSYKLRCLWETNVHVMVNLAHLVVLDLKRCYFLTCLWENDANIQLPWLEVLDLQWCTSLVGLPNNFGWSVPNLKKLKMIYCSKLKTLPNSIGLLAHLVVLELKQCHSLTCLWKNDANIQLPCLEVLDLQYCGRLVGLPNNFGRSVPKLKRLELEGCLNLKMLPNSTGLMAHLVVLGLKYCANLTCLWENDANIELPRLEVLGLQGGRLVGLPNNFGRSVPKLNKLEVYGCKHLKMLSNSIGLLVHLVYVDLDACETLTCLWENDANIQLPRLEVLQLRGCPRLIGLPNNFGRSVPNLKRLKLDTCGYLKTLPNSIGLLAYLVKLDLISCEKLTCLWVNDANVQLPQLEVLGLEHGRLVGLPNNFGRSVPKLKTLEMRFCQNLKTLPNSIGGLVGLKLLHLSHCKSQEEIPMELGRLINLKELNLLFYENKNFSLLNAGKLKSLLKVVIQDCKELLCIDTLPQCLEHLELKGCCSLIENPSLKPMKSLVYLNLIDCQRLRHIHGLECLTNLEFINVVNCALIEDDGVAINEDNKALHECDLRKSKVGVAYNNGWLKDGPSEQVLICEGNRIPSFLPNGVMAGCSVEDNIRVAEATISRKAECIVITWCLTVTSDYDPCDPYFVRLYVYRGGEVALDSVICLPHVHDKQVCGQIVFCVTLRKKNHVVEAVKPGDKLSVSITTLAFMLFEHSTPTEMPFCTMEANVCVVYDGGGHLLLEVNSELLSKDASRQLEEQFGELVLKDHREKGHS